MNPRWKGLLAAGSALLLLLGAGCAANQTATSNVNTQGDGKTGSLNAKTDATVNAAVDESDASAKQELEENADANVVTNDAAELNAYGKAYDQNSL